jgi:hypothetical protein
MAREFYRGTNNTLIIVKREGLPDIAKVESLLSLTAPEDATQLAFHIVAPTLPGFVFSSSPKVGYLEALKAASC